MTDLPARLRAVATKISAWMTDEQQGAHEAIELLCDVRLDLDALLGALETEPPKDLLESLHAIFTRHGIASYTMHPGLVTEVVHWAAEGCRQSHVLAAGAVGCAEPPDGWQPIETAPKDGREVVLIGTLWNDPAQRRRACISRWCTTREESPAFALGWYFSAPGYSDRFNPTHWLPAPPVTERRAP